ncbi:MULTISPECIES: ribosome-inactivating family protein [unclassified Morganella (in: enterobacteria)]|uniref:ribosome-inactivating family protein n=1 Tax=unclassified Morganella (in: enterobacteria) TaxID=2676694 RepID=UPI002943B120|nr:MULTISPECIES: ribosome-inactivating family protein [unclassified Morganella (in: enterobacteria)]
MKKIMAIIIFCFYFHAYAELNITPINDDFDYSNNLKYNESIRKLRSELSDHSSGYGKNVYISEKENKLYRIKIHSDEKKSTFISLVYNARNAYLLGFITNKKKEKNGKEEIEEKYYRFKEDTLIDVKDLTTYTLNFSGNYSDLEKNSPSRESIKINHNSLKNAIITLNNHHENNGNNTNNESELKKSLLQLILFTSESIRFPAIMEWNSNHLKSVNPDVSMFGTEYKKLTNDWGMISKEFKKLYAMPGSGIFKYSYRAGNMQNEPQPYRSVNIHELCLYALYIPDKKTRSSDHSIDDHKFYSLSILGEKTFFPENQFMYINYALTYTH